MKKVAISLFFAITGTVFGAEAPKADDAIRCIVQPIPDFPEAQVIFNVADGQLSIGESSFTSVSTTIFYPLTPVALFKDLLMQCAGETCTESETAELALNPYIGACENEGVQMLIWENYARINGQYFVKGPGTSVHTD